MLLERDRVRLLDLARQTLCAHLRGESLPVILAEAGAQGGDPLTCPRGAFVSYHRSDGTLRGCVGLVQPIRPLWEAVREMALAAATRDGRFDPISPGELADLGVEVSVLSPLEPCRGPHDLVLGTDGVAIRKAGRSGLLLPQVAEGRGWTPELFLEQTCRKAGLPADAWREGAEVAKFRCEILAGRVLGLAS
ncbi:MAG: AmmeMemoRadiSam system protein A [Planctomycetes bacterium]|nr:AmmeMemoRadiSam system protein A [Planctomycetota bacterium]